MSPEQFKKEQAALHEPSATEGRFMFPEQFKKEQAASHEPPVGAPPFVSAWVVEGWLGTLRSRRLGVEDPTRFNAEAQRTQRFMVREQVRKEHGTSHDLTL